MVKILTDAMTEVRRYNLSFQIHKNLLGGQITFALSDNWVEQKTIGLFEKQVRASTELGMKMETGKLCHHKHFQSHNILSFSLHSVDCWSTRDGF